MRSFLTLAFPAAVAMAPCLAQDGFSPILTDIASSPLSDVPGVTGAKFISFDRPFVSLNGQNYAISADTDLPGNEDDVLIVNGRVAAREDDMTSFVDPGDSINAFDQGVSVNDSGQYAFSLFQKLGSFTNDEFIIRGDSTDTFTVIQREETQLVGAPMGVLAGSLNTSAITNAGDVWFETDFADNTAGGSADDTFIIGGTTLIAQGAVTIPGNQLSGLTEAWQAFDFEDLFVSADGTQYILQGDLLGSATTDDVVVVSGNVVVQEGFPLPGGPADAVAPSGISEVRMEPGGSWMVEGRFGTTNQDFIYKDGAVVALESTPIFPGSTENYTSFFGMAPNSVGDFVVAGLTNADSAANAVLVANNDRVILREGDPIDLDGNGMFDDDLFISFFSSDDFKLTNDGMLYFVTALRDSTGSNAGDLFGMIDINAGDGIGTNVCTGVVNSTGVAGELSAAGSIVAADNDLTFTASNLPPASLGLLVNSRAVMAAPFFPLGDGVLCIGPGFGRHTSIADMSDASGMLTQTVDLTALPRSTAPFVEAAMAGQTWYFQLWHRDAGGMTGSNLTNALEIVFQ